MARLGEEDRRLMHLVPATAVRLMERQVLSRPGVNGVSTCDRERAVHLYFSIIISSLVSLGNLGFNLP